MKNIFKYITSFLLCVILLLTISGCSLSNTPTMRVEKFLDSYKNKDKNVLTELKEMIDSDGLMNDNQKDDYSNIIKKQYSDLTYDIKDEKIDGNKAVVTAEIEVYDFYKTNKEAEDYYNNNKEQFTTDNTDNNTNDNIVDDVKDATENTVEGVKDATKNAVDALTSDAKYIEYRLGKLKTTKDRVKYTIDFNLTKNDGVWTLDDIDDITRQKIHGLYEH